MKPGPKVVPLHPDAAVNALFNAQARVCADCDVRRRALFGALDLTTLDHIHVHIAEQRLEPGQRLFGAGQQGVAAYTIRSGVVRLERSSERGAQRIVRLAGRGDLVGMESMLGQTYSTDALACTAVEVCRLPRTLLDDMMGRAPELTRDLMRRWQRALDDADEWLVEMTAGSARHRMLRLLLKLSEYQGQDEGQIWLPSREQMGALLGITLETSSRLVSAFRRDGLLEIVDARHARVDLPRLLQELRDESSVE